MDAGFRGLLQISRTCSSDVFFLTETGFVSYSMWLKLQMLMKAERKHGYCKNFQSTYNLVRREKRSRRKNQGWSPPGGPVVGPPQTSDSGSIDLIPGNYI